MVMHETLHAREILNKSCHDWIHLMDVDKRGKQ